MANRDRQRQGLVYGPVRPSGPRDRGRILGNLLGFLVVVITAALLGAGIYLFIQSRGVAPASSPASAQQSSSPGPSLPGPTIAPSGATTGPPSTPPVTPGPTVFVPPVVSGPGFITFGTNADAQLHVTDPKTTFAVDEPMVWSAELTEPANSSDLTIRILKQDASQPTGELLVREDQVQPDVRNGRTFFRRLKPFGSTEGTGLFTIQYVRGDQVLSSGAFVVQ